MEDIKFELQFKHESSEVIKMLFSQKLKLYFIITFGADNNLIIYNSKTFELIYKSKDYRLEDYYLYNIYELKNGNFILLFGNEYSKIEIIRYNQKLQKIELIQTIIEKSENWNENYSEMLKKME